MSLTEQIKAIMDLEQVLSVTTFNKFWKLKEDSRQEPFT